MARVKLVGGMMDGSETRVADDVDVINVPKQWARNRYRPIPVAFAPGDSARYRRHRYDVVDMCWIFVPAD